MRTKNVMLYFSSLFTSIYCLVCDILFIIHLTSSLTFYSIFSPLLSLSVSCFLISVNGFITGLSLLILLNFFSVSFRSVLSILEAGVKSSRLWECWPCLILCLLPLEVYFARLISPFYSFSFSALLGLLPTLSESSSRLSAELTLTDFYRLPPLLFSSNCSSSIDNCVFLSVLINLTDILCLRFIKWIWFEIRCPSAICSLLLSSAPFGSFLSFTTLANDSMLAFNVTCLEVDDVGDLSSEPLRFNFDELVCYCARCARELLLCF